ncbi:MAG: tetraacyldisaccharide 4'-kinase [Parachlamydiales bacterium]|nr:tetraacyldisaccharide 4'-kinase [Parachlamydiales bacterium]
MKHNFFLRITSIIKGEKRGIGYSFILFFLYLVSLLFKSSVWFHQWLYHFFLPKRVPVYVISIGNIVAGGTGKTPFTLMLAGCLDKLFSIAILTRGYGRNNSSAVLLKPDKNIFWKKVGDEPKIFLTHMKKGWVGVGKDRVLLAKKAYQKGAQVAILDDGMQYRHLKKDYSITIVDATDPFGHHYFLPRGFLRDFPTSLQMSDLIVINNVFEEEKFLQIQKDLRAYSHAPCIGMVPVVSRMEDQNHQKIFLSNSPVGVFCAIAHPEHFLALLKKEKIDVVTKKILADHAEISFQELSAFAEHARNLGARYLMCTEKDRVKLNSQQSIALPVITLQIKSQIIFGNENWEKQLEKIVENINNSLK